MQAIVPLTSLEETRHLLRAFTLWILTAIKVFGTIIILRLELIGRPDKIYQWLSAVIPSTNYHGALKVRLEDTGLWFIDGARFARWKATANDFVWICGTRMYSHHLGIIHGYKLVWQPVQARLS
jgi:hypothetical protein